MAINEGVRVNLRMRFTATIYRAVHEDDQDESRDKHTRVIRSAESGQLYLETSEPGQWTKLESGPRHAGSSGRKDREVKCSITRPVESFEVLNDLVVDRGPSPYVSLLELFGEYRYARGDRRNLTMLSFRRRTSSYYCSSRWSLRCYAYRVDCLFCKRLSAYYNVSLLISPLALRRR